MKNVESNPACAHNEQSSFPHIGENSFIHPFACVIGDVTLGCGVMISPFASIRADEGSPFFVGNSSNVQDGVIIHALETCGDHFQKNTYEVDGKRYAVYVGKNVSLAHQAQLHGPVCIEDGSFVGMQCFVFHSRIGKGCVIEPGAKIMNVRIEPGRYVSAGSTIDKQEQADLLPHIDENYVYKNLNLGVVKVNVELARAYNEKE